MKKAGCRCQGLGRLDVILCVCERERERERGIVEGKRSGGKEQGKSGQLTAATVNWNYCYLPESAIGSGEVGPHLKQIRAQCSLLVNLCVKLL
jgi:triosephosphate isomerase